MNTIFFSREFVAALTLACLLPLSLAASAQTTSDEVKNAPAEGQRGGSEPPEPASVSTDVDSRPAAGDFAPDFADHAPESDMVPVRSDELSGIWLGTADNVAVVIRFIGRESRRPGRRGTIEGEWFVDVPGHTTGSGLQFIDDETAGVVELEVGLWNSETDKGRRASLGRVERGVSGRLYLSIYGNEAHAAYPTVNRILLSYRTKMKQAFSCSQSPFKHC